MQSVSQHTLVTEYCCDCASYAAASVATTGLDVVRPTLQIACLWQRNSWRSCSASCYPNPANAERASARRGKAVLTLTVLLLTVMTHIP